MATIWGIHSDQPSLDLISGGFVSVGWDEIGDLKKIGANKEELKHRIEIAYPDAKPGAIPIWAGVLMRFGFEMSEGDYVINPTKADSTLKFGQIAGPYYWDEDAEFHRHRRPVKWLQTGVPRAQFSKNARYEIGSAVTLFKVKSYATEFLSAIEGGIARKSNYLGTQPRSQRQMILRPRRLKPNRAPSVSKPIRGTSSSMF